MTIRLTRPTPKRLQYHRGADADFRQISGSRARARAKRRYVHMDAGNVIRFARVDFRNDDRVFGIKDEDRFLHVYVIGKTGTGKSTLIETMALHDLERGNGFALIDPHGDLVARVAARVPASHRDKVISQHAPFSTRNECVTIAVKSKASSPIRLPS